MHRTKNVLALIVLFSVCAPGTAPVLGQAVAPTAQEAIATVNGQEILVREFDLAVQIQFRRRRLNERGLQDLQAVRQNALDSLIENELLYQQAKESRIKVSDSEIDKELKSIQRSFGSASNLQQVLDVNGVTTDEFREQIRRSLAVVRFVDRKVAGDITVPDGEVQRFYDSHQEEMKRQEAVRISQIVVEVSDQAPPAVRAAGRELIEQILFEVQAGKDFAELARRHSDGPEAEQSGDVGFVTRGGRALPAVEKAAFALRPGEISDIVESRRGYHIIKATEQRPAGMRTLEEVRDSIRTRLENRQREEKLAAYLAELKRDARIERNLPGS